MASSQVRQTAPVGLDPYQQGITPSSDGARTVLREEVAMSEPRKKPKREEIEKKVRKDLKPDWTHECECCGATPIVPATGMCGPCTFGEADTAGGNW